MTRLVFVLLAALVLAVTPLPEKGQAAAQTVDYRAVAEDIARQGDAAVARYRPDLGLAVSQDFSRLYFDIFENKGLEYRLVAHDRALLTTIESQFGRLISLSAREVPAEEVGRAWTELRPMLIESGEMVSAGIAASSPARLALQAGLILLREGIEAMLVVTALIAFLRRAGAGDRVGLVWQGVGLALVASLGVAYLFSAAMSSLGAAREIVEGVTVLLAAAILAYVSCWLFARRDARRWQAYLGRRLDSAISGGSLAGIVLAAFLSVFREGAETVLFLSALRTGGNDDWGPIGLGCAGALILLVAVHWAMRRLSVRLPIGRFLAVAAAMMLVMAVSFLGQGISALQISGLVGATPLALVPTVSAIGLFPTIESLAAQTTLVAAIAALWWRDRQRTTRQDGAAAGMGTPSGS